MRPCDEAGADYCDFSFVQSLSVPFEVTRAAAIVSRGAPNAGTNRNS